MHERATWSGQVLRSEYLWAWRAVIRCSTGCTRIPTGAENRRTGEPESRRTGEPENRSGGDRVEQTPMTEKVGGIPLPNQIRAETPGMHQTKPHPRSSLCASKQRRCQDARSVQDEDRGQGRLKIEDRQEQLLRSPGRARLPAEWTDRSTAQEVKSAVTSTGRNSDVNCKSSRSKDRSRNNRSEFPRSDSYSQRCPDEFEGLVEGLQVRGR